MRKILAATLVAAALVGYGSSVAEAKPKPRCHVVQVPGRFGHRIWICEVKIK